MLGTVSSRSPCDRSMMTRLYNVSTLGLTTAAELNEASCAWLLIRFEPLTTWYTADVWLTSWISGKAYYMTVCSADGCIALRISGELTMSEKAVASSALLGLFSNDIVLAFTLLFCARMIGNSVRVAATTAARRYIVTCCPWYSVKKCGYGTEWGSDVLPCWGYMLARVYILSLIVERCCQSGLTGPQRGWFTTITSTDGGMVSWGDIGL